MSPQTLIIDYTKLCKYLDEASARDPSRTHSYLDILRENTKNNLFELLQGDMIAIDIDHTSQEVSIFGEKLKGTYKSLMPLEYVPEASKQQYILFSEAMDIALRLGVYKDIFLTLDERSARNNIEYALPALDIQDIQKTLELAPEKIVNLEKIITTDSPIVLRDSEGMEIVLSARGYSESKQQGLWIIKYRSLQTQEEGMLRNFSAQLSQKDGKIDLIIEDAYDYKDDYDRRVIPAQKLIYEGITYVGYL